jgi:hypothetical protein
VKAAVDQVFHPSPLKIWNATQKQSCVPEKIGQFLYWDILKCPGEIWRTRQKLWRKFKDIGVLTKGWPQVGVDSIKRVIRACWLSFRGDDPCWPWFDQSWQCLTRLIRSLALMMLIKNLGRHIPLVSSFSFPFCRVKHVLMSMSYPMDLSGALLGSVCLIFTFDLGLSNGLMLWYRELTAQRHPALNWKY